MAAISTAVELSRVSAITGYEIKGSLAGVKAGNLPIRIAILAESNTANQTGLPTKLEFASAKAVGDVAGYGSPAHIIARILRPVSGDKLGGIPTILYPILEADTPTATVITISVTGTATKAVDHKIILCGRDQIDGDSYSFSVAIGDTQEEITQKMADAINNVLSAPVIATITAVTFELVLTSKWRGVSSAEVNASIDINNNAAGLTYAEDSKVAGTGLGSAADGTVNFGDEWNTFVINAVGADSATLNALELFNGNANDGTGRYVPTVFKPFMSFFGNNAITTLAGITAITDARKLEMTNVFCPAPNSDGFSFEAAANVVFLYAKMAQDTPQSDPINLVYPDMPASDDIGEFSNPTSRDAMIKVGSSTVKLNSAKYQIVDLATTYHPTNEPATATIFRWVRDIVVYMNIKYKYSLLYVIFVEGKTIVSDNKIVGAANTISPKRWKGVIATQLSPQLQDDGLSADAEFMNENTAVQIGESNPNRFETNFKVKITGVARVGSNTIETLFNFN